MTTPSDHTDQPAGPDDEPVPAAEQPMLTGVDDDAPVQGEGAPDSY